MPTIKHRTRILIVDSSHEFENNTKILFSGFGFSLFRVPSCMVAIDTLNQRNFKLSILLLRQGFHEECYSKFFKLRQSTKNVILVGVYGDDDFVSNLHMELITNGADIVVLNPQHKELAYQSLAILRRFCGQTSSGYWSDDDIIAAQGIEIRLLSRKVFIEKTEVKLPLKEFEILVLLAKKPWVVMTYNEIYEAIWEEPFEYGAREVVWSHIYRLRFLLKVAPDTPQYIKNTKGYGYSFEPYPKDTM